MKEYEKVEKNVNKQIHIFFNGSDAEILEAKAKSARMNVSTFVKWMIRNNDFALYEVKSDDLENFIHEIHESTFSITSLVDFIKRNNDTGSFETEIQRLIEISSELSDILKKQLKHSYYKRNAAYTEKVKELCDYGDC